MAKKYHFISRVICFH